ncbi:hypothetical protein [Streptosporangium sp. NPDC023615]|uniref:hypothetical protein n=1 Tax=Streptosporangium sp. NPDC023615 TaxID=3154794 RepID=UPI00343F6E63
MVIPGATGSPTPAVEVGTTAGSQLPIADVDLPGDAVDYSRVPVHVIVKDGKGRVVGRGRATFPRYEPVEAEQCFCYDAFVQVDVRPGS